jgi:hypothetical protein
MNAIGRSAVQRVFGLFNCAPTHDRRNEVPIPFRVGATYLDSASAALAVRAPWPTTRPTLTFLQFLLGPANAAFPGDLLFRILYPADELIAGQWSDVLPRV